MSQGQRLKTRYQFRAGGLATLTHTCRIECDPATTSLVVNTVANVVPPVAAATQRQHRWTIPIHVSTRARSPRARFVRLAYAGDKPPGIKDEYVEVPVLTIGSFNAYQVGQVGTYRGLPVRVVGKSDGVPDVNGA